MNNLLDMINAADKGAIAQTNFQRIDASLAFALVPSLDLKGEPTPAMGPAQNGAFVTGQLWVDALLAVWRCTADGSPGTWIQITPAIVADYPAPPPFPPNYLIRIPAQAWGEFYWNGNQWLAAFVRAKGPTADETNITVDQTSPTIDQQT